VFALCLASALQLRLPRNMPVRPVRPVRVVAAVTWKISDAASSAAATDPVEG
jgi:hypothetical protein